MTWPDETAILLPPIDLAALLKDVPPGAWVAIAHDHSKVLAYSNDLAEAIDKAREQGEPDPYVARAPESQAILLL